jgi:LysM repeat protein
VADSARSQLTLLEWKLKSTTSYDLVGRTLPRSVAPTRNDWLGIGIMPDMSSTYKHLPWILLTSLLLTNACGIESKLEITPQSKELQPYLTTTPSVTPDIELVGAAETPLPSATPFTYTVIQGDTMIGIASKFGVSLENLMKANPDVLPSAMAVGQELRIPSAGQDEIGEPTPAPVPLEISQVKCYPTLSRGLWCLVLVHNDYPEILENLSAQVSLLSTEGEILNSQPAIPPLNILPPDESIPLVVFFQPEIPPDVQPRVQMLTAIRLLTGDNRYLPAILQNILVEVDWSGKNARVSGKVFLPLKSIPANQLWVAGVGYDAAGNVVGVRRWEASERLDAGGSLPFEFMVSSLAATIVQVELIVEARP